MKFHIATFLTASELLVLIQYTGGLLMQPSINYHGRSESASSHILTSSQSGPSVSQFRSSPLSSYSKSVYSPYSLTLHAERSDDRIFKAGGGVPQVPTGEMQLFNPGEQGMKGGTMDLTERLKNGVGYQQVAVQSPDTSSSQPEPEEFSLFDPGEEGLKGGTSDFAERLKSGANFGKPQVAQQPTEAPLQANSEQVPSARETVPEVETQIESSSQANSDVPSSPEPVPAVAATEVKPANSRAAWPYRPMVASSSHPTAAVRRSRSSAIRRGYPYYGTGTSSSEQQQQPPVMIESVNEATPKTIVTPPEDSEQQDTPMDAQTQETKASDGRFWAAKQSKWWDNPGGSTIVPH